MSEFLSRIAKLSPQRLALLANELNERLEAEQQERSAPIAIIGMGCRLPGGVHDAESFWNLLSNGVDAISEVPPDRWNIDDYYDPSADAPGKMNTRWGGFIEGPDQFDPKFFGIAPAEAISMDPQQRLLLETAWQALEDAGIPPNSLAGSPTGVFVGLCNLDYGYLALRAPRESITPYFASGLSHAIAAGRISYLLGLEGPNLAVDTSCSASLMAVHLACQSLRRKESNLALAGGANLILTPEITVALSQSHMMAPDGRCKAFSDRADGFVRAEGSGIIVLKRLGDAVRDGDRIRAVIRGTAANQDGRSSGLTAPNGRSQEAVVAAALADAGLKPDDVQYIEAHGTGTSLGDPIEVGALGNVFGQRSSSAGPLRLGSIKSNFGHLESAAGIAGLMKLVLSLQHREIPATLHCRQPNHRIDWNALPVQLVQQKEHWQSGTSSRVGGVSSFGFSGTNVHVVVEEHREHVDVAAEDKSAEHTYFFPISAKSPKALAAVATRLHDYLSSEPHASLPSVARTLNTGRSHFEYRAAFAAASREELLDSLQHFDSVMTASNSRIASRSPRIAFLFANHDGISANVARDFYESMPVFQAAIHRCDSILQPRLGQSLAAMLYPKGNSSTDLPDVMRPLASFVAQFAMAELWRSCGIEPAVVLGDGTGEYVAACVSGALTLEEALALAAKQRHGADEDVSDISWATPKIPWLPAASAEMSWLHTSRSEDAYSRSSQRCTASLSMASSFSDAYLAERAEPGVLGRSLGSRKQQPDDLRTFLSTAIDLYTSGSDLDLTRIYGKSPAPIVSLPSYPFERERYWIETKAVTASSDRNKQLSDSHPAIDWTYELSWEPKPLSEKPNDPGSYATVIGEIVAAEPNQALLHLSEANPRVHRLCASYVIEVLQHLGAARLQGRSLSADQVCQELNIAPSRRRVLGRLLNILAEDGILIPEGTLYRFSRIDQAVDTASEHAALQSLYPEIQIELDILRRCANKMPAVLQGTYDPMQLVFAEGSVKETEQIYQNSPVCRYFNRAVCDVIQQAIATSPGRKVRILEIGAGTGATTASVLPEIAGQNIEYTFTDISPVFLAKGRDKFRGIPGVDYRLLNIERNPAEQGFIPGSYDIVLAANVLHATTDLRQTVAHARALLRTGGLLMLIEGAWPDRWLDLTFGLTDGWWRFADFDLRPQHPLLSVEQWCDLFQQYGLSTTRTIRYEAHGAPSQQVLLLACAGSGEELDTPKTEPAQRWVILSDDGGIGQELSVLLNRAEEKFDLIPSPGLSDDPASLMQSLRARWPKEILQIVYLRGADIAGMDDLDQGIEQCGRLPLRWMRTIQNSDSDVNLWLVTRGAQATQPHSPTAAFQAMIWGLGRTFGLESPRQYKKLIDLDHNRTAQQNAACLFRELFLDDMEDQLVYREEQRLVPRIRPTSLADHASAPVRLRSDASYLITGGLGAVGSHLTRWAAESGAGHIVVLSRRGPKDHPESARLVEEVESQGSRLTIVEGDVASSAALDEAFKLFGSKCPPLRGVFHVATVQSVAGIAHLSDEQLMEMLRPKVIGASLLHERTKHRDLDFFIAFSSTVSVTGSRDMAHYAAANQFLDSFAHARRAQNLPMLSINWGSWQRDHDSAGASLLARMGLLPMDSSQALHCLSQALHSSRANIMVANVNWSALKAVYETRRVRPMLAHVGLPSTLPDSSAEPSRASSAEAPVPDRSVAESVTCAAAAVLGFRNGDIPPRDVPLTDLGLDSLMAVDLRNRLQTEFGRELPSTIVFDYPTISGLSAILESMLWIADGQKLPDEGLIQEIQI